MQATNGTCNLIGMYVGTDIFIKGHLKMQGYSILVLM